MKHEKKLKIAIKNYGIFLNRTCSRGELIELVVENAKNLYPHKLIELYFKHK